MDTSLENEMEYAIENLTGNSTEDTTTEESPYSTIPQCTCYHPLRIAHIPSCASSKRRRSSSLPSSSSSSAEPHHTEQNLSMMFGVPMHDKITPTNSPWIWPNESDDEFDIEDGESESEYDEEWDSGCESELDEEMEFYQGRREYDEKPYLEVRGREMEEEEELEAASAEKAARLEKQRRENAYLQEDGGMMLTDLEEMMEAEERWAFAAGIERRCRDAAHAEEIRVGADVRRLEKERRDSANLENADGLGTDLFSESGDEEGYESGDEDEDAESEDEYDEVEEREEEETPTPFYGPEDRLSLEQRNTLIESTRKVDYARSMFEMQRNPLLAKKWMGELTEAVAVLKAIRENLGLEPEKATAGKRKRCFEDSAANQEREESSEKKRKIEMSEAEAIAVAKEAIFEVFRGEFGPGEKKPAVRFVFENIAKGVDSREMWAEVLPEGWKDGKNK